MHFSIVFSLNLMFLVTFRIVLESKLDVLGTLWAVFRYIGYLVMGQVAPQFKMINMYYLTQSLWVRNSEQLS